MCFVKKCKVRAYFETFLVEEFLEDMLVQIGINCPENPKKFLLNFIDESRGYSKKNSRRGSSASGGSSSSYQSSDYDEDHGPMGGRADRTYFTTFSYKDLHINKHLVQLLCMSNLGFDEKHQTATYRRLSRMVDSQSRDIVDFVANWASEGSFEIMASNGLPVKNSFRHRSGSFSSHSTSTQDVQTNHLYIKNHHFLSFGILKFCVFVEQVNTQNYESWLSWETNILTKKDEELERFLVHILQQFGNTNDFQIENNKLRGKTKFAFFKCNFLIFLYTFCCFVITNSVCEGGSVQLQRQDSLSQSPPRDYCGHRYAPVATGWWKRIYRPYRRICITVHIFTHIDFVV